MEANRRPTDPLEYRVQGIPILVEYFGYEEGKYGVNDCLDEAMRDFRRRLLVDPGLRNTLMGPAEIVFDGSVQTKSYLYLHPGEDMTWNHWVMTLSNIRNVVRGLQRDLNGAGFYFKINVDNIGQVGEGNFTQISELFYLGLANS